MGKKKGSIVSASTASSSRRPPARDLAAEGSAQTLKDLNRRLVAETAELRKQKKRLSTRLILADSGSCKVDHIERAGVTLSSRHVSTAATTGTQKAAEQEKAVEMAVTTVASGGIESTSTVLSSSPASIATAATATFMAAEQDACAEMTVTSVNLVSAGPEQSRPITSIERDGIILLPNLASSAAGFIAGCAADLAPVEVNLTTETTRTQMKKIECKEEAEIEKLEEKKADCTEEEEGIEKRLIEKLKLMEEKLKAVQKCRHEVKEEMKSMMQEMNALKMQPEEKQLAVEKDGANKKSKWGIFKWIVPAGVLVAVTCAVYAKAK